MPSYSTRDETYSDLVRLARITVNARRAMRDHDIVRAANAAQALPTLGDRIKRELDRRRDHALKREGLA